MAKTKTKAQDEIEIDGYYVREVLIKAPPGAPFSDIRLVLKRATNHDNLLIDQSVPRLLDYMDGERRRVYTVEDGRRKVDPHVFARVRNLCVFLAQTLVAEGMPDFEDWADLDLGMDNARKLEAYDRVMALDGGIYNRWVDAINAVEALPGLELDPKASAPASGAG